MKTMCHPSSSTMIQTGKDPWQCPVSRKETFHRQAFRNKRNLIFSEVIYIIE